MRPARPAIGTERVIPVEPSAPVTTTMSPEAKAHYDRGLQLYGARNFVAAIGELELGFSLDPHRAFLFAQAQAFRLAGNCVRAVPLYRRFLESAPSPLQIEAAQLGVLRCEPNRSPPSAKPAPMAPSASALRVPIPPLPPPDHPIWWRDPWAALSIGTGVALLGVAAGFEIASARARDDAAAAARTKTYSDYTRPWQSAEQRRAIAVTAAIGGAVLLAVGGTELFLVRRRARASGSSPVDLSFLPARGGGSLIWQGGF